MALTDIDIDAITEADLVTAIREGLRVWHDIAFAPEAYKHPFVRDVSSLANTRGGLMLVGIEEQDGMAKGFAARTGDPDTELRELARRVQEEITPEIPGVRLKAVRLSSGGAVMVLHVPASKQAPHRVASPRDPRSTLVYVRDKGAAIELHPRAITDGWFG